MKKAVWVCFMVLICTLAAHATTRLTGVWTGKLVFGSYEYTFTMNMNDRSSRFDRRDEDPIGILRYTHDFVMDVRFDSSNRVLRIVHSIDPKKLVDQIPEKVINHFALEMTGFYYAYTSGARVMNGLVRFHDILLFTDPGHIQHSRINLHQGNWSARPIQ